MEFVTSQEILEAEGTRRAFMAAFLVNHILILKGKGGKECLA
jgi:hypothetical protein